MTYLKIAALAVLAAGPVFGQTNTQTIGTVQGNVTIINNGAGTAGAAPTATPPPALPQQTFRAAVGQTVRLGGTSFFVTLNSVRCANLGFANMVVGGDSNCFGPQREWSLEPFGAAGKVVFLGILPDQSGVEFMVLP